MGTRDPAPPRLGPDTWKENLFLSEEEILQRYQTEKAITGFVLQGNYAGAQAFWNSLHTVDNSSPDFVARTRDEIDRLRQMALIMNSSMRITVLNTNVPIPMIHGIATYFGRIISTASEETLRSGILLDTILRAYCTAVQEFGRERYSPAVEKIVDYITLHVAEPLTLSQLAQRFSYSPAYLNRILKRETGFSAIQYIKRTRIAWAKSLLRLNELSIEQIAAAVGYPDQNYFCRVFRQIEQISPSQYRGQTTESENSPPAVEFYETD